MRREGLEITSLTVLAVAVLHLILVLKLLAILMVKLLLMIIRPRQQAEIKIRPDPSGDPPQAGGGMSPCLGTYGCSDLTTTEQLAQVACCGHGRLCFFLCGHLGSSPFVTGLGLPIVSLNSVTSPPHLFFSVLNLCF